MARGRRPVRAPRRMDCPRQPDDRRRRIPLLLAGVRLRQGPRRRPRPAPRRAHQQPRARRHVGRRPVFPFHPPGDPCERDAEKAARRAGSAGGHQRRGRPGRRGCAEVQGGPGRGPANRSGRAEGAIARPRQVRLGRHHDPAARSGRRAVGADRPGRGRPGNRRRHQGRQAAAGPARVGRGSRQDRPRRAQELRRHRPEDRPGRRSATGDPDKGDKGAAGITEAELAVCTSMGLDPAEFAKHKEA